MKRNILLAITLLSTFALQAQTTTDGLMMPKNNFCTGFMGTYDKWTDYWEGTLKRDNGNIGSITTTSVMWFGNYGLSDKLNILASVPFVMTKASAGTLHGMQGIQDLMLNVKYKFLRKPIDSAVFSAFVVGGLGTPLTDYSPDFLPLSIGMASKQANARLNLNYFTKMKLYVNGSVGYTFRSHVELDRESYYSDGEIYFTNQVDMPNVLDFSFSVGYINRGLETKLSYMQQNTQGGGDIRRQDMPFVSNQMNFSKVEALAMYYLPKPKYFAIRGSYAYTVAGCNVGQSSTVMAGLLYTFHFSKSN
jgi:hypothetical protein